MYTIFQLKKTKAGNNWLKKNKNTYSKIKYFKELRDANIHEVPAKWSVRTAMISLSMSYYISGQNANNGAQAGKLTSTIYMIMDEKGERKEITTALREYMDEIHRFLQVLRNKNFL